LDGLILGEGWPLPDFIKIDAEGAEYDILRGGKRVLAAHDIALFIEINQETLGSFQVTLESLWDLLRSLGYRHFTLVGRHESHSVADLKALEAGMREHFSPSLLCRKGSESIVT
jgi:hypothetical protein